MKKVATVTAPAVVVLSERTMCTAPTPRHALLLVELVAIVTAPAVVILSATRLRFELSMCTAPTICLTSTISLGCSRLHLLLPRCTYPVRLALALLSRVRVVRLAIRLLRSTVLTLHARARPRLRESSLALGALLGRAWCIGDLVIEPNLIAFLTTAEAATGVGNTPIARSAAIATG